MKKAIILAAVIATVLLPGAVKAKEPNIEVGCDAGSSIKVSGIVDAIELTGVGGQASQTLTVHLSDNNTYYTRADASAGLFAGYVALFSDAYFNRKPVTIRYGCEVGLRIIHVVNLP
jgi:hypothetical protein